MKKDYSKEFISQEIAELFRVAENFVVSKDTMNDAIRAMYLNLSTNN